MSSWRSLKETMKKRGASDRSRRLFNEHFLRGTPLTYSLFNRILEGGDTYEPSKVSVLLPYVNPNTMAYEILKSFPPVKNAEVFSHLVSQPWLYNMTFAAVAEESLLMDKALLSGTEKTDPYTAHMIKRMQKNKVNPKHQQFFIGVVSRVWRMYKNMLKGGASSVIRVATMMLWATVLFCMLQVVGSESTDADNFELTIKEEKFECIPSILSHFNRTDIAFSYTGVYDKSFNQESYLFIQPLDEEKAVLSLVKRETENEVSLIDTENFPKIIKLTPIPFEFPKNVKYVNNDADPISLQDLVKSVANSTTTCDITDWDGRTKEFLNSLAPKIDNNASTEIYNGLTYNFRPDIANATDQMTFQLVSESELPEWMTFDTNTGALTGEVPIDAGYFVIEGIQISVEDQFGGTSALNPFSITGIPPYKNQVCINSTISNDFIGASSEICLYKLELAFQKPNEHRTDIPDPGNVLNSEISAEVEYNKETYSLNETYGTLNWIRFYDNELIIESTKVDLAVINKGLLGQYPLKMTYSSTFPDGTNITRSEDMNITISNWTPTIVFNGTYRIQGLQTLRKGIRDKLIIQVQWGTQAEGGIDWRENTTDEFVPNKDDHGRTLCARVVFNNPNSETDVSREAQYDKIAYTEQTTIVDKIMEIPTHYPVALGVTLSVGTITLAVITLCNSTCTICGSCEGSCCSCLPARICQKHNIDRKIDSLFEEYQERQNRNTYWQMFGVHSVTPDKDKFKNSVNFVFSKNQKIDKDWNPVVDEETEIPEQILDYDLDSLYRYFLNSLIKLYVKNLASKFTLSPYTPPAKEQKIRHLCRTTAEKSYEKNSIDYLQKYMETLDSIRTGGLQLDLTHPADAAVTTDPASLIDANSATSDSAVETRKRKRISTNNPSSNDTKRATIATREQTDSGEEPDSGEETAQTAPATVNTVQTFTPNREDQIKKIIGFIQTYRRSRPPLEKLMEHFGLSDSDTIKKINTSRMAKTIIEHIKKSNPLPSLQDLVLIVSTVST